MTIPLRWLRSDCRHYGWRRGLYMQYVRWRVLIQEPKCFCDLSGEPTWVNLCEICPEGMEAGHDPSTEH